MDSSDTTVRWINLDAKPPTKGDQVTVSHPSKTVSPTFFERLKSAHQGQIIAPSGKLLPNATDPNTTRDEVRFLSTERLGSFHNTERPSGGPMRQSFAAAPQLATKALSSQGDQNDLIQEISAFNREVHANTDGTTANLDSSALKREPNLATLESATRQTQDGVVQLTQASIAEANTNSATANSLIKTDGSAAESDAHSASQLTQVAFVEANRRGQLLETASSHPQLSGSVSGQSPHSVASLTTQAQQLALGSSRKSMLAINQRGVAKDTGIPAQTTTLKGSAQQATPVKLVMLEATATLQQWQSLKQLDDGARDSATEAAGTVLQTEARSFRAPPELQVMRVLKSEVDAQALSQKFAEQLGQRLIQQVEKGHWRAELELHPKSLGRIDVKLDFINGQLDGHFQTHNPLTRELLLEGLPRLREWLQQTGTQVANLEVNNGNAGAGGEKPTPQQPFGQQEDAVTDEQIARHSSDAPKSQAAKEGFDLLV